MRDVKIDLETIKKSNIAPMIPIFSNQFQNPGSTISFTNPQTTTSPFGLPSTVGKTNFNQIFMNKNFKIYLRTQ